MKICDEDGVSRENHPIYKSLLFDTKLGQAHYHFCDGNWYQVEDSYVEKLRDYLDPYFEKKDFIAFTHGSEGDYNQAVAFLDSRYICLDKTSIGPPGQHQVEPCDLFKVEEGKSIYCHIKLSTRSSTLSHLFNQGVNSIELIKLDIGAKEKMKLLIRDKLLGRNIDDYVGAIDSARTKIVYAIITHKVETKKSDNLPLFSRISLKRCIKSLKLMSVEVAVCFVNDESQKKQGKKKKRKNKAQSDA